MSSYSFQRYPRKAAIAAKNRIRELSGSKIHKIKPMISDAVSYIKKHLVDITQTPYIELKSLYANNIYQLLLKNPSILVQHPVFCKTAYLKLFELEGTIQHDVNEYHTSGVKEQMQLLSDSLPRAILTSQMQIPIITKMAELKQLLASYETMIARRDFVHTIDSMKALYQTMNLLPDTTVVLSVRR